MNNEEFKEYVKKDLLETFNWLEYEPFFENIEYNGDTVVNMCYLDVNYAGWHDGVLSYQTVFSFTDGETISLTPDNYKEFKKVLRTWKRHFDYFHTELCCDVCDNVGVLLYDECTGESVCENCAKDRIKNRIKNTLEKENNE